jgi:Transglycosylase SLT domain
VAVLRAASPRARALLPALVLVLVAAGLVTMFATRGGKPQAPTVPGGRLPDPYAWTPAREAALVAGAARGTSHLLYTLSPGGAEASAARTARWRGPIAAAARRAGVDPGLLEGLVFLESAGRPDAVTPAGLDGAVGLTQILPETARDLLRMHVDVAAAKRLTRRIARAHGARLAALERRRARADQRFDPRASLNGTARYLSIARKRFGRQDLAFVSYHMGIGNLEGVLDAYGAGNASYARVYFDSTPTRHAAAWRRLASFGDDSSNYLWKVMAGRDVMSLWRRDRAGLRRLAALQTAGDSAEHVLHPPATTPRFADEDALKDAFDDHRLLPVPNAPRATGLRVTAATAAAARRADVDPELFRGLRPEALALALYVGAQTRAISGNGPLEVSATVRDTQAPASDDEPPGSAALHDTGWAFDVRRRYRSPRQAQAFQFALDRLQVLDVIAWSREGSAIHVTVGAGARPLLPLLDRIGLAAP